MTNKMYSFRIDKELMDRAKRAAGEMDMSLSFFIRSLIRERLGKATKTSFLFQDEKIKALHEVSYEIRKLRSDLKGLFKDKD
jgi:antitoxin component of RelBE/YafQ-DinJ toxin-antitoxin module